ncbi:MAG: hypothetical protein Q7S72_01110 [Candidatus Taylorbacteria bacterium]|nr:hypothetical protein [Candidatus Taylorbacteria bacterium]
MSWIYIEREQFIRMCDRLEISVTVREAIKAWAPSVSNKSEAPRLKLVYRTPNNRYESWSAGIPNPDSNRGKSGGYRVVYFLDLKERTINLDFIDERKNLGFGNERPKDKQKYMGYISELKRYLNGLE